MYVACAYPAMGPFLVNGPPSGGPSVLLNSVLGAGTNYTAGLGSGGIRRVLATLVGSGDAVWGSAPWATDTMFAHPGGGR